MGWFGVRGGEKRGRGVWGWGKNGGFGVMVGELLCGYCGGG